MKLCDSCGINEAGENDYCPYSTELLDEEDLEECNCCDECHQKCLDTI